jgi:hypothetical protein
MGLFDEAKKAMADAKVEAARKDRERAEKQRTQKEFEQQALLEKAGLSLRDYDYAKLCELNADSLRKILAERGWSNLHSITTFTAPDHEKVQINLLKIQVEQNFILIRQNEHIIRLLSVTKQEM